MCIMSQFAKLIVCRIHHVQTLNPMLIDTVAVKKGSYLITLQKLQYFVLETTIHTTCVLCKTNNATTQNYRLYYKNYRLCHKNQRLCYTKLQILLCILNYRQNYMPMHYIQTKESHAVHNNLYAVFYIDRQWLTGLISDHTRIELLI